MGCLVCEGKLRAVWYVRASYGLSGMSGQAMSCLVCEGKLWAVWYMRASYGLSGIWGQAMAVWYVRASYELSDMWGQAMGCLICEGNLWAVWYVSASYGLSDMWGQSMRCLLCEGMLWVVWYVRASYEMSVMWRQAMGHLICEGKLWAAFPEFQVCSTINSSPPNAPYMPPWTGSALAQIMACRLFGARPLSKPMLFFFVNWTPMNKLQWNFNQNTKLFIHENAFESPLRNGGHLVQGEMS